MTTRSRPGSRGLQTIAGQLTAMEGPFRRALTELSRLGIGERIVKSALAATIAWLLAAQIPRESAPFVAALTAVYTIDLTILKSLRSAWQRLAGITVGIAMAFLAAEFLGVHSWTVGLVILISLVIGLRLNLKSDGMTHVAGTAVLVLVVRSTTSERSIYALTFLADTAIGTAIGLAVNSFFSPPNFVPTARTALEQSTTRLALLMQQLSTLAVDGMSADEGELLSEEIGRLGDDLRSVDESLRNAEESLKFSPLAGRQRSQLAAVQAADQRLETIVTSLQRLADALGAAHDAAWMADARLTGAMANLIDQSIDAVPAESASDLVTGNITNALDALDRTGERAHAEISDSSWRSLGQVLQAARELSQAVCGAVRETR